MLNQLLVSDMEFDILEINQMVKCIWKYKKCKTIV